MDRITIEAEVGHDHRLVDALPPEVPVGRVRLVIEPVEALTVVNPAREVARAKLRAAGALGTAHHAPEEAVALSDEALQRLGQKPPGATSLDDLINADRGEY